MAQPTMAEPKAINGDSPSWRVAAHRWREEAQRQTERAKAAERTINHLESVIRALGYDASALLEQLLDIPTDGGVDDG